VVCQERLPVVVLFDGSNPVARLPARQRNANKWNAAESRLIVHEKMSLP
jgi:hypothetical protein